MFDRLYTEIGEIKPDCFTPYFTDGSWSMHELLYYVLMQTGKADIWLTAFSLSEQSVRTILKLQDSRLINSMHCVFNTEMRRFKTDLTLFAKYVFPNIRFASVHAKLILIKTESLNVAIVGSQNFSINKRYEAGMIITDINAYNFYYNKLNDLWLKSPEM